jgi:hypothetical protein
VDLPVTNLKGFVSRTSSGSASGMAPIFAMCSFKRNNTREEELEWSEKRGGEKVSREERRWVIEAVKCRI